MSRREQIEAQIAALQEELTKLAARTPEPDNQVSAVFFEKSWGRSSKTYTYVGVKTDKGWFVSTTDARVRKPNGRLSWDDLLDFADESEPDHVVIIGTTGAMVVREKGQP